VSFDQEFPGNVCITMAAEAATTNSAPMFVRARVDGVPAVPGDVLFHIGPDTGTRTFHSTATVPQGPHTVAMQYRVDSAGGERRPSSRSVPAA